VIHAPRATSGNLQGAAEKLLEMAVKWASASDEPGAECRSRMLDFLSVRRPAANHHADLNLLLHQFNFVLFTGSGNFLEVNSLDDLTGRHSCAT